VDDRAAIGLLERALSLTRPFRPDVHAELDLAQALAQQPARATRIAEEAAVRAAEAGDETGAALARAMASHYRLMVTPSAPDELEALLLDARGRLEEAEDHAGLALVWWALGFGVANVRGRADDWATAALQAHLHRRLAGRSGTPPADLGVALIAGSRPADEALEIVDRLLAETPSAWLQLNRAWLLAMLDRGDEARRIAEEANERLRDQADARWGEWMLAEISTLAGDYEDATDRLRILCEWLETRAQFAYLETYLALLGRWLSLLRRFDEAEQFVERARALEEARAPATPDNHIWRRALARVYAHRGEFAEAERLARDAVAQSEQSESLDAQCCARWDLAEVLAAAGRPDEAAAALEQALERCRRKKNLALAKQVGNRLAQVRGEVLPA
jgi:tetratricopeptide (TPR) repeat protein